MNPSNHAENYQPPGYTPQLFIAIEQMEVMMQANPSDKSVGDADRASRFEPAAVQSKKSKGVIMGQATLDLPDPLEKSEPPAIASADDLLAQLAGDEIDRLLAESDAGKPLEPAPAPAIAIPTPEVETKTEAVLSDANIAALASPPVEPAPAVQISEKIEEPPDQDDQTIASERSALAAQELSHQTMELPNAEADLPVFLKPLVWLNAPLESFPDEWREALGKVAILTLVNAIAVLAYVMIFRRHH